MNFPAFVCRDWIQSAPFFQQIDNVCPINYINLVLADKRSHKESSGRKCHRVGESITKTQKREGGHGTDAMVWWYMLEVRRQGEKMWFSAGWEETCSLEFNEFCKHSIGWMHPLSVHGQIENICHGSSAAAAIRAELLDGAHKNMFDFVKEHSILLTGP